ncbi:unnamed protein product [Ilex paraguariensis]|uniref:DNA/RNA-binding protein Alba-like domain-containing protein n=1 Tax=Ilex paraguariensis TaxID=185542 RepID=A0ABC8TIG4_9AQUA
MDEITEGVTNITISGDPHKKNRIQVSNTKKPLFFYVNLAKRYMQQHNEVELSALGMGILSYPLFFYNSLCSLNLQELSMFSLIITSELYGVCAFIVSSQILSLCNMVQKRKAKIFVYGLFSVDWANLPSLKEESALFAVVNHFYVVFSISDENTTVIYAAIATVVTIAEILKNNGLAVEKKITTSSVDMKDESRGRSISKAKIEILLGKTANFDELMAAAAEERAAGDGDEQS